MRDCLGDHLKEPHGNVSMQEGHPLQQEPPGLVDSHGVRAPVFKPIVAELLQEAKPLMRGNVPDLLFLDFREHPGLD